MNTGSRLTLEVLEVGLVCRWSASGNIRAMRLESLWYKSAVIYEVDVRTFLDTNGDGWGDFQGRTRQLDYIASLGATCIWLKPFNVSPQRDGGYGVADHYEVDERIGSMGDFVHFLEQASSRGVAVIVDLVASHTSNEHPWFVEASSSRDSAWRDFYIWRDEPASPEESPQRIVFEGGDKSVWSRPDGGDQYYLHRFYPHEPDLNNANAAVREEIYKILAFYLRLGAAGFRLDAAPYIAEKAAESSEYDDPHDYLREMRSFLARRRPDAVFMAEADVDADKLDEYFGRDDEMNLLLNFLLSQHLFLALAEGDTSALHDLVDILPQPPHGSQYANFLRNHDELDLERLEERERQRVLDTFAPDEDMRIYGRGLRRRVAPMLDGDEGRVRLAHSLLFAMPGTPIVYYGDEIGMGEDLGLSERDSVRTPMQWTSEPNGGFSSAESEDLFLPVIAEGRFGYPNVNVADQSSDPDSMLNWTRRLIGTRKQAHMIGTGDWSLIETGDPTVFAIRYASDRDVLLVYHNVSHEPREVKGPEPEDLAFLQDVFADAQYERPVLDHRALRLNGYGYRWLRGKER